MKRSQGRWEERNEKCLDTSVRRAHTGVMFEINDIVVARSGFKCRVVEPGIVVTGVLSVEQEGFGAETVVFWPTVSLTLLTL